MTDDGERNDRMPAGIPLGRPGPGVPRWLALLVLLALLASAALTVRQVLAPPAEPPPPDAAAPR